MVPYRNITIFVINIWYTSLFLNAIFSKNSMGYIPGSPPPLTPTHTDIPMEPVLFLGRFYPRCNTLSKKIKIAQKKLQGADRKTNVD
jgi:hypothetical protein